VSIRRVTSGNEPVHRDRVKRGHGLFSPTFFEERFAAGEPDAEKGGCVTDGPHMDRAIELDYDTVWEGSRGHVEISDAWLE